MTSSRRAFLRAGGAAGLAAVAGCLGGGGSVTIPEGTPESTPTGPIADIPIPDDPGSFTYAQAGSADAPVVTYFGNWKCPACRTFSQGFLEDIMTDYVASGDIRLQYRGFAYLGNGQPFLGSDSPRAARAGLLVWALDPDSYWPFHAQVFDNQPSESEEWATVNRLTQFAWEAGVSDLEAFSSRLADGDFEDAVRANTQAGTQANIQGTPTLVVGNRAIVPLGSESQTRSLIEQYIANS